MLASNDDGFSWHRSALPSREPLYGFSGTSRDLYVIGDAGRLYHATAPTGAWARVPTGTSSQLFSVWASGQDLFLGGNDDLLLHSSNAGKTWNKHLTGRGMTVALWGTSRNDVYAGTAWRGAGGAVLHTSDGAHWETLADGLRDVAGIGGVKGRVFVALTNGALLSSPGAPAEFTPVFERD
jgi:photosystem II stability/assembly factor-like uncharacterized protein